MFLDGHTIRRNAMVTIAAGIATDAGKQKRWKRMNEILAIDPGNIFSGYVIADPETLKPLEFGILANEDLEALVYDRHGLGGIVIERIAGYGMPVGADVFETCEEFGRLQMLAELRHIYAGHVYRKDEKLVICQSPKANDTNIRRALIDRFAQHDLKNGKGTKKDPDWFYGFSADMWAAYAVAVTWHDMHGSEARR